MPVGRWSAGSSLIRATPVACVCAKRFSGTLTLRGELKSWIAAALILSTAACTTIGQVPPRDFVISHRPMQVWITETDSSVVSLFRPRVLGDTLTGFVNGKFQMIPLTRVQLMNARRSAPGRTTLLVAGAIAGVVLAGWLISGSAAEPPAADTGGA